ncbi:dnaJ homolog subfamily A member 4-like [Bradysia coprophila]|uniref:dnaJ homolog subfamily A member 4-like n=1 Tax=Bradysia coprophila TaxID=38358 RepID=UPI00187DBF40|nr:dnaJ homolog subfamily A member 4-like [Bradysia coprophila]XP_037030461.1 dnaJ homolog subfamily A member 4-like [Bradysia coprophila]
MAENGEVLPRTKYLKHTIHLTLDELYNGTERKLAINKNRVCNECVGTGAISRMPDDFDRCEECQGMGVKSIIIRTAPDIQQRIDRDCYLCWGKGLAIVPEDRCPSCRGEGVVEEQSGLIVKVRRGSRHGQKIIYKDEGTQEPNMRPGDVVVILETLDHPIFTRDGDDLIMKMNLDLVESLCGFEKLIQTLDKRQLCVKCPKGSIIKHNDEKYLPGEGMPKFRNPTVRGKMIIKFTVTLPDRIRTRHIKSLEQCLPPREVPEIPIDAKECNLVEMSEHHPFLNQNHSTYNLNDDECAQDQYYDQQYESHDQHDQYGNDNHYDHQYGDEQYNHQGQYYHDDNSYEVQGNYEHPSEYDQHHNQQGYESQNHFHQEDFYQQEQSSEDVSLESYDATQQYRSN